MQFHHFIEDSRSNSRCMYAILLTAYCSLTTVRYLQMSGMIIGSAVEADQRLRLFEAQVRAKRRMVRDQALWRSFHEEYGKDDDE
jgi:hypothetical protein